MAHFLALQYFEFCTMRPPAAEGLFSSITVTGALVRFGLAAASTTNPLLIKLVFANADKGGCNLKLI